MILVAKRSAGRFASGQRVRFDGGRHRGDRLAAIRKTTIMTTASRPFQQTRTALLHDPELAALYLEEALAAGDTEAFKLALRNVAEARLGGMTALAKKTDLSRESLYRALSDQGNPTLATLSKVLGALGLRVAVQVDEAIRVSTGR